MSAIPLRRETPEVSEAEMMRQLAAGDLSTLGELYDRYAPDVRRFVMRASVGEATADDLTHDAFLALADSAGRYDEQFPVRSFVIGIAGKLLLRRRRRGALVLRMLSELRIAVFGVESRTPEAVAAADEQLRRYRDALEGLSEAKRVVVVMADVEGLSGPEIAACLDIPVGTVWTRLHHARAELRHALRAGGDE